MRRRQVAAAVSDCLASVPSHIVELNAVLSTTPIDLRRVTRIISSDSEFRGLLLSLASTELFNTRSCEVTLAQGVVLFGSERLRALALGTAFLKNASRELSISDRQHLWQHSFLAAVLSERTARQLNYGECGQAYIAGLLHDVGRLPLLVVAREEKSAGQKLPSNCSDVLRDEHNFFGVDHCEIGRLLAATWNLAPSLIDAVEYHHSPAGAKHDPDLAEIVAAGDQYADALSPVSEEEFADGRSPGTRAVDALLQMCVPKLETDDSADALEMLQYQQFDEAFAAQLLN